MSNHLQANIERFSGFADCYDDCRPQPPAVVVDMLTQLARVEKPELVVDIGSGTGLSTRIWAGRANRVIGIEPNADMRAEAERRTAEMRDCDSVGYQEGTSTATGLPDACADIVTCVQSLHWMEPEPTFAEIGRLLRPGGVFAAIDCEFPPAVDPELDAAHRAWSQDCERLQRERGVYDKVVRWSKSGHLQRMLESGKFSYVFQALAHQVDSGNKERYIGGLMSHGGIRDLMRAGLTEDETGVTALGEIATRVLGDRTMPWFWSYGIRLGVK